jgi:hypothetical protein
MFKKKIKGATVELPKVVDNTIHTVEVFQASNGFRYDSKEKASTANLLTFVKEELISFGFEFGSNPSSFYRDYTREHITNETFTKCINDITKDEETFKRFVDAVKTTKGYNI